MQPIAVVFCCSSMVGGEIKIYYYIIIITITPLTFSLVHLPPPLPCVKVEIYSVAVWLGGGGGMVRCVGDHILQEFNTKYLTRFRT
jgi:hypothetical protein